MAEHDTAALEARIIQDAKIARGSQYRTGGVLLRMADDQLRTLVLPELLKAGEGHLATTKSVALTASQSRVRMPPRAVRLLDVSLVNALGLPVRNFSRATPQQERELRAQGQVRKVGTPRFWFLEGSTVVLSPPVESAGTFSLLLRYARRPSRLVATTEAWTITSVNETSGVLGLFGTEGPVVSEPVDVLRGTPGFESVADDLTVATVQASGGGVWEVTLNHEWTEVPSLGDYMSRAGTAPVPQVPLDYHPVLAQAVVVQVMKEMRDTEGMTVAKSTLDGLLASAQPTIEARSNEPEVCINDEWL